MCFFEVQAQGATETPNQSNNSNNYINSIAKKGERKIIKEGAFNISHRMSHSHGASSFENINRQGPSSVQSVTADTSSQVALEINSKTSVHAAQENQNQTYEKGGEEKPSKRVLSSFNMLPHRRPNANVSLERSKSCPGLIYGYFSDEEDIDKNGPSSVRSFPLTRHSHHLVLDVGSDAATAGLRPFRFEIPKSYSASSTLQEVNQSQAYNMKGARRFHKMSHPRNASVEEEIDNRQACTDQCLVRSASIPPYSPYLPRGDGTNHAALDVASQERLSPIEENPNHIQRQRDCLTLYRAALKGNWREAEDIIRGYPDGIILDSITEMDDTVLHIASATKHATFVKEVVGLLTKKEELEQKNKCGDTAFCIAAESGIVTIAEEMWKKNEDLVLIRNKKERTPLQAAALFGHRDMVAYLLPKTSFQNLTTKEKMDILVATITHDMYDITFEILVKESALATANNRALALRELARKPSAIGSRSQPSLWKSCLNYWLKRIFNKALMETLAHQLVIELSEEVQLFKDKKLDVLSVLTTAAKVGNAEFLIILIRTYPDIMWITDSRNRSLFHIAVINRQESVFNLIHEVVTFKEIILTKYDKPENENILHLAGYLAPPSRLNIVSGAALQMQRELLWFKEVEMIVLPSLLKTQNSKNLTPWDLFTMEHENLRRDGEKWMKNTAKNCMLVATLITTVVYAAAFTVPGGSNQVTGIAIFHKAKWFRVFFISDAIALVSSSSSILMFLSILTSRFAEMDFLVSLPLKLVLGLTTLLISIVGMLVAFSATCFLVFKSEMAWLPTFIITLAVVAIILFVLLHLPLCVDIIRSTFFSRSLFRPRKKSLF
ncbi:ankyrin repeat-containing protein ITN1-like isoform X4 [Quercus robur]|uniref:ankyrin repeat-containing protein ITN1-like isoform X4 n=1 Tax=Quercus robur TaxID=38942 RepID=UPI002162B893|nr:ankyrin repeat-containing protein ITN1-like isoform X4 [Quercus robur]